MNKKKTSSITVKNSMRQLAAGIVPNNSVGGVAPSPNMINSTIPLMKQVRPEFVTTNYALLSFLYQQFGWIQSIIEVPVLDAFRGGVQISAYEKKVVVPEKRRRGFFSFWNAEDNKKTGDPKGTQEQFLEEQQKRRDEWEKEQLAEDEKRKKIGRASCRERV